MPQQGERRVIALLVSLLLFKKKKKQEKKSDLIFDYFKTNQTLLSYELLLLGRSRM